MTASFSLPLRRSRPMPSGASVFFILTVVTSVGCFERGQIPVLVDAGPDGDPPDGDPPDGDPPPLTTGTNVRGLQIVGDSLLWSENGTFDELNNYNGDGRIRSIPLEGGGYATTVVSGLRRPWRFEWTPSTIHFASKEGFSWPGEGYLVTLDGSKEPVQLGGNATTGGGFVDGRWWWTDGASIYSRSPEDSDSTLELVGDGSIGVMVFENTLYQHVYDSGWGQVRRWTGSTTEGELLCQVAGRIVFDESGAVACFFGESAAFSATSYVSVSDATDTDSRHVARLDLPTIESSVSWHDQTFLHVLEVHESHVLVVADHRHAGAGSLVALFAVDLARATEWTRISHCSNAETTSYAASGDWAAWSDGTNIHVRRWTD